MYKFIRPGFFFVRASVPTFEQHIRCNLIHAQVIRIAKHFNGFFLLQIRITNHGTLHETMK
jgi:hypothetical protein